MYLSAVLIRNFRGIRNLEINFEQDNTVLIGENSWGKSSLLRALWLALGQGEILCSLKAEDMYIPINLDAAEEERSDDGIDKRCSLIDMLMGKSGSLTDEHSALDTFLYRSKNTKDGAYGDTVQAICPDSCHDCYDRQYLEQCKVFNDNDIYNENIAEIEIRLIFKESQYGLVANSPRLQRLMPYWMVGEDGLRYIYWQILGYNYHDEFITEHNFLDDSLNVIEGPDKEESIKWLIHMNPVLRVRDSRAQLIDSNNDDCEEGSITKHEHQTFEEYIGSVSKEFSELAANNDYTASEARRGLETLDFISKKYLAPYNQRVGHKKSRHNPKSIRDMVASPVSIESLSSIRETLNAKAINKEKILAFYLASALFLSKGNRNIDKKSKPILILEDIEARFHPSILLSFWSVVASIPIQKIITTNSGDFLSAISLGDIRRLCRLHYDTRSYAVREKSFSADDLRRIAFHIRINRPTTLFARCWVLVEGETEIWILNQIASILGISMHCIGIRPIEFAQCGLHPLIKLARQLGINFYVLTDGDEAGHKYAQTVIGSVGTDHAKKHMTVLPHRDIEHFLFAHGYDNVFCRAAGLDKKSLRNLSQDKIIDMAIKKKTKPGLALEVMEAMAQSGAAGVPRLFVKMFKNLLALSRADSIVG